MQLNKKSTEQAALGDELDGLLGPEEFKALGQELALVIARHKFCLLYTSDAADD